MSKNSKSKKKTTSSPPSPFLPHKGDKKHRARANRLTYEVFPRFLSGRLTFHDRERHSRYRGLDLLLAPSLRSRDAREQLARDILLEDGKDTRPEGGQERPPQREHVELGIQVIKKQQESASKKLERRQKTRIAGDDRPSPGRPSFHRSLSAPDPARASTNRQSPHRYTQPSYSYSRQRGFNNFNVPPPNWCGTEDYFHRWQRPLLPSRPLNLRWRRPPPPAPTEAELQLQRVQERQQQAAEETARREREEKEKTRARVEQLRDRLKQKRDAAGDSAGAGPEPEPEPAEAEGEPRGPAEGAQEDTRSRTEMDEGPAAQSSFGYFPDDIHLNYEDVCRIGTGQVPEDITATTVEHPADVYLRGGGRHLTSSAPKERVAKEPGWLSKDWWRKRKEAEAEAKRTLEERKKKRRRISDTAMPCETAEDVLTRRQEFSAMTEHLRSTILGKDKEFLQELIDSPSLMKQKLMAQLVRERQQKISEQLNKLRFGADALRPPDAQGEVADADRLLADIERLEADSACLAKADLAELPEELVKEIERMIRMETFGAEEEAEARPNPVPTMVPVLRRLSREELAHFSGGDEKEEEDEDDDEVVEVAVPPKPPAPLVNLNSDDEEEGEAGRADPVTNAPPGDRVPPALTHSPSYRRLSSLQLLCEEESQLLEEMAELDTRRAALVQRLDYNRRLRTEMINSAMEEMKNAGQNDEACHVGTAVVQQ